MKYKLLLSMFLGLLSTQYSFGQSVLTLDEALAEALANNHQIKIQKSALQATAIQADPSMVGLKPIITLNAGYELGWADASIETLSLNPEAPPSEPLELSGWSNDITIAPEISWLLLDGKASRYRLDQLDVGTDLAQLQVQQTIEQTITEVTFAYLDLAQQQQQLQITEQSLALGLDRLNRARQDASYGTSSSLQELQIRVDVMADSASLRNQLLDYENRRRDLNQLIGRSPNSEFRVSEDLVLQTNLQLSELETEMSNSNIALQVQEQRLRLADLGIQTAQAANKPRLQAYGNVSYAYLQNDASFLLVNRALGPNVGLRFSYPIADGGARRIRQQVAVLEKEQRLLEQSDTQLQLQKMLHNAYAQYRNGLEQLRIEETNLELFERNLTNLENRFRLGTATLTEVRAAQLNLSAANNRITAYRFNVKRAEIQLYLLSGKISEF
ncbi:MAG: TolC family protein [Bacteroidota bacterium]